MSWEAGLSLRYQGADGFASAQSSGACRAMLKLPVSREKYDEQMEPPALPEVMTYFLKELNYEKEKANSHGFSGGKRAPGIDAGRLRGPQNGGRSSVR